VACHLDESPDSGATAFADGHLTRDLRFRFSAARRTCSPHLSDEENEAMFGIAAAPGGHGHNYRVRIVLEGEVDELTGLTVPYVESASVVSSLHDELDHRNLNLDVPGLAGGPITTEVLARYIYNRASQKLPVSHICLWENDNFFVECYGRDVFRTGFCGRFYAAHRLHSRKLSGDENIALYGKCNNEQGHGHQYEVEVVIESQLDERTGTCFDLVELDRIMSEVLSEYDYKHLDEESADFADCPSTGENIVSALWKKYEADLAGKLSRLRLWETPNNLFTMRRVSPLRD
jgi:6-pyruvoyltetrahydropterin/6-carboxytetrahydropterin synthase